MAHLARLVDDLMDLARIGRGRIERKVPLELAPAVRQAVERRQGTIEGAGPRPDPSPCLAEPIRLEADPTRLEQVVWNLLSNAAKYTEPGAIRVSARREGAEVVLRVRDSGIGIEPEMLQRVFGMFAQVDHAGLHAGGLGIGCGAW